jgi:AraC-like DNA-binding protein
MEPRYSLPALPRAGTPRGRGEFDLAELRSAVDRLLRSGYPTVQRIAGELQLSPRTLQRRLSDLGISYRDLIRDSRFEQAGRLLAESARPVADIAASLGYADASSFSRFFLRMAGMTPRAYRARARSGSRPRA